MRLDSKTRRALILISGTILFATGHAWPQRTGLIRGYVYDARTQQPLPGANVMLEGTPYGAAADDAGYFEMRRVRAGEYRLIAQVIGYRKRAIDVAVSAGDTISVRIALQPSALELGQVVVTASRFEQDIREVPVTVHAVDADELARRNVREVGQALRYLPGVQVAGSNISIRGSSGFSRGLGSRVLLLFDGIPFLTADQGDVDWDAIPILAVKQVEVMKGPGSALYGSNALGGVLNILPNMPGEESRLTLRTTTGVYDQPGYSSWRWSNRTRYFGSAFLDYQRRFGNVGISLTAGWKEDMSYKENDDSKGWVFSGLGRWELGPDVTVDLIGGMKRIETGSFVYWRNLNHALNIGNEPPTSYTRTTEETAYVFPVITRVLSSRAFYRLRLRWRRTHAEDWRVPRPNTPVKLPRQKYRGSTGSTVGAEWQINLRPSPLTSFVFGVDAERSSVRSIQYGERSLANLSGYGQVEYRPLAAARISLGARWDEQILENGSSKVGQVNPKVGLTWDLGPAGIVRASLGRGFRAPSIAEKYISTVVSTIRVIPNPELRPERSWSAEAGYNRTFGDFLNLDLALFGIRYWDFIEPQLVPGVLQVQFRNVTDAVIRGAETYARFQILPQRLQGRIGYTYLHTEDRSVLPDGTPSSDYGKPLKYRPRHSVVASLEFQYESINAGADFRYYSKVERVDRVTNIPDIERQVPVYVLDLRAGVRRHRLSLEMVLENALQYYYLISPGNLGPLRNLSLQLEWSF